MRFNPIFTDNIWIGGLDGNESLHLAAQTHHYRGGGRGSDFSAGPVAG